MKEKCSICKKTIKGDKVTTRHKYKNTVYTYFACKKCYSNRVTSSVRKWRTKYPERNIAHGKVFIELRAGRIIKQPCFCGKIKSEAHHEDYSKPLEIIWLCKKHHIEADKKRPK